MSIKKVGQDGEYLYFFQKNKFLLNPFFSIKKLTDFVIFCS